MSEETKNELLDDEGETPIAKEPKKKPAKVEAKVDEKPPVQPEAKTPKEQVKADALAKFPKDIVAQTKYILDNSEHVNFIIPQMEGEIGEETVQINGYKLTIKKNVMVSIPVQVAAILAEKYKINLEAGKDKEINRASDVSNALN